MMLVAAKQSKTHPALSHMEMNYPAARVHGIYPVLFPLGLVSDDCKIKSLSLKCAGFRVPCRPLYTCGKTRLEDALVTTP